MKTTEMYKGYQIQILGNERLSDPRCNANPRQLCELSFCVEYAPFDYHEICDVVDMYFSDYVEPGDIVEYFFKSREVKHVTDGNGKKCISFFDVWRGDVLINMERDAEAIAYELYWYLHDEDKLQLIAKSGFVYVYGIKDANKRESPILKFTEFDISSFDDYVGFAFVPINSKLIEEAADFDTLEDCAAADVSKMVSQYEKFLRGATFAYHIKGGSLDVLKHLYYNSQDALRAAKMAIRNLTATQTE